MYIHKNHINVYIYKEVCIYKYMYCIPHVSRVHVV